jgi:SagB-type dehydrogenase family enzyme
MYHYSAKDHSLELLKSGDLRGMCVEFAAGQEWTRNASVLFLMTAAVARTAWKYRIPRVYRAFLLDAGHLSQSFLLVSTALGLGAFCIGIINDLRIEKELGVDGVNETVVFAVGVGQPAMKTRP